jgi:hypothetical protein
MVVMVTLFSCLPKLDQTKGRGGSKTRGNPSEYLLGKFGIYARFFRAKWIRVFLVYQSGQLP